MAWPNFTFRWPAFSRFNKIVMVLDWLILTLAVCILLKAIGIKMSIGHFINMISNRDGDMLPIMLAIVAILAIPVQCISIGIHFKMIYGDIEEFVSKCLLWVVFGSLLIATCALITITVAIVHTRHLQDGVHNGIVVNMHEYIKGKEGSLQIDLLQTRFQCCGSASFREWFYIKWDAHMRDEPDEDNVISDDVPHSCCLQSALAPCIHNNIKSPSSVYRYDPRTDLRISTVGCHESIVNETRRTVSSIVAMMGVLLALEVLLSACKRVEQTALTWSPAKDGQDIYRGWLFGSHFKYLECRS